MKTGTVDVCRKCGRVVEFIPAPHQFDDEGNDITPFWMKDEAWVDVDPPGDEVWNRWCDHVNLIGAHQPLNYCTWSQQSGGICYSRVSEPTVIPEVEEKLYFCKKHIKHAIKQAKHEAAALERKQFGRWESESEQVVLDEMRKHGIRVYDPKGYIPSYMVEELKMVDVRQVVVSLLRLEATNNALREALSERDS
jgi:hypothetical protein